MSALILATDILEKIILFGLLGLSIWSVMIMIDRRRLFKKDLPEESFFEVQKILSQSPSATQLQKEISANLFIHRVLKKSLAQASDAVGFERALSSTIKMEKLNFEKGLSVLATLGANAPFIGLFGTVLGIIRAFAYLGTQSGSSAVMSGVSQALYATALGLMVAIPAVVANNYFAHQWKKTLQLSEAIRDEMLARKIVG